MFCVTIHGQPWSIIMNNSANQWESQSEYLLTHIRSKKRRCAGFKRSVIKGSGCVEAVLIPVCASACLDVCVQQTMTTLLLVIVHLRTTSSHMHAEGSGTSVCRWPSVYVWRYAANKQDWLLKPDTHFATRVTAASHTDAHSSTKDLDQCLRQFPGALVGFHSEPLQGVVIVLPFSNI